MLHCFARYPLNSSVVCACKLSNIRMDLALGSSLRPRIRPLRYDLLAHSMQNVWSAHAFSWENTSTSLWYAAFLTGEIRVPWPRKITEIRV